MDCRVSLTITIIGPAYDDIDNYYLRESRLIINLCLSRPSDVVQISDDEDDRPPSRSSLSDKNRAKTVMKEVSHDPIDSAIPFSAVILPRRVAGPYCFKRNPRFFIQQNRPSAAKKKPTTFDSDDSDEFDPTPAKRGRR